MAVSNGGKHKHQEREMSDIVESTVSLKLANVVVFCAALLCFANSYDGEFVFDDAEAVENNKDLLPSTSVWSLLEHDFWGRKLGNLSHKSYRPVTVLTFRWNYWLAGGLHPNGFHIVNIFLHGVVSVLMLPVFHLALSSHVDSSARVSRTALVPSGWLALPAFLSGLLFATHPVHTESVAGTVGRADLLCAVFFILAFLSYVKGCCWDIPTSASLRWIVLSMALCFLATFSKEQGITVIGLCSAYDILYVSQVDIAAVLGLNTARKPDVDGASNTSNGVSAHQSPGTDKCQKRLAVRHIILLLSGLFLLSLRWQVMGSAPPTFQVFDNPHSFVNGTLLRGLNYNYLYAINAWLLLCPVWLCFDWSMGCVPTLTEVTDVRLLSVVVLWLVLALLLWGCLFSEDSRTKRTLTLSLALIIVPFLPATNLLFRVGFVVAERALYLPSAGFCMLVVTGLVGLVKHGRSRFVVYCMFGALILTFMTRSVQRSNQWRDGLVLFKSAERVCPLNAKVHYNIAKLMSERGGPDEEIIDRYWHAIHLSPDYDQAMNNLANILKDRDQEVKAEGLLDRAVAISPEFAAAWMNRGIVKASLKKYAEAEYSYRQGIRHRRKYPDCYYNLGNLFVEMNRSQEALDAFHNATRLKPTHWNAWNNAIILLDNLGLYDKASKMAQLGLKQLPDHPSLLFSLANVLGKAEKWQDSEAVFQRAIRVNPANPSAHLNLGVLYHRWGKLHQAEKAYQKALELDPNNRSARENYNMLKARLGKS